MKRRVFNIVAGLSLTLFLVVALFWFNSRASVHYFTYWWESQPGNPGRLRAIGFTTSPRVFLIFTSSSPNTHSRRGFSHSEAKPYLFTPSGTTWNMGPVVVSSDGRPTYDQWSLYVEVWALVGLLAVVPIIWVFCWLLRRRANSLGACRACGYDLRASKDKCPECGAAIGTNVPAG